MDPRAKLAVEHLKGLTVWTLAGVADVTSPDTTTSPGADFLSGIRDDLVELIEELDKIPDDREDDRMHQIADGAPSIFTHTLWQEFVDLCAYQEDIGDWTIDGSDLEAVARIALYQIAGRLTSGLVDAVEQHVDEQDA